MKFRKIVDPLIKHLVPEVEGLNTNAKWVNQPENFVLHLREDSTDKYSIYVDLSAKDGNSKIAKFNSSF
jgi:hypothetical protein